MGFDLYPGLSLGLGLDLGSDLDLDLDFRFGPRFGVALRLSLSLRLGLRPLLLLTLRKLSRLSCVFDVPRVLTLRLAPQPLRLARLLFHTFLAVLFCTFLALLLFAPRLLLGLGTFLSLATLAIGGLPLDLSLAALCLRLGFSRRLGLPRELLLSLRRFALLALQPGTSASAQQHSSSLARVSSVVHGGVCGIGRTYLFLSFLRCISFSRFAALDRPSAAERSSSRSSSFWRSVDRRSAYSVRMRRSRRRAANILNRMSCSWRTSTMPRKVTWLSLSRSCGDSSTTSLKYMSISVR